MSNHRTGRHIEGLPVFSTDAVTWNERELPGLQQSKQDTAVRFTLTDMHQPFGSAVELTSAADELFERFATMCGATLIDHEWGFAELPRQPMNPRWLRMAQHPIYPTGYTLVAEVEIIRRIFNTMPQSALNGIIAGHNNALATGFVGDVGEIPVAANANNEPFRLTDYPFGRRYKLPRDFAYGRRGKGLTDPNALFFVDIEPYILSNDPNYALPYTPYIPTEEDYRQCLANPGF